MRSVDAILDPTGQVLAVGRWVRVTLLTSDLFGEIVKLDAHIALIRFADGEEFEVPVRVLMLSRRETDRMDAKGRALGQKDAVLISAYGGRIARVDVGGRGTILGFTKTRAIVDFVSDYQKTKSIPFEYLTLLY